MINDVLHSIDMISDVEIASEINVLESMLNSYNKANMILENCQEGDDISAFSIFRESYMITEAAKTNKSEPKNENGLIKVIKKIGETIKKIVRKILIKFGFKNMDDDSSQITPKKAEKRIEKVKKFVIKHPALIGVAISPAIVGFSWATINHIERTEIPSMKKKTLKEFNEQEQEKIKEMIDIKNENFIVKFDINAMMDYVNYAEKVYINITKHVCDAMYKNGIYDINGVASFFRKSKLLIEIGQKILFLKKNMEKIFSKNLPDYLKKTEFFRYIKNSPMIFLEK